MRLFLPKKKIILFILINFFFFLVQPGLLTKIKPQEVQAASLTIECSGTFGTPTAITEASYTSADDVTMTDTGGDGYCALDNPLTVNSLTISTGVILTHIDEDTDGVTITAATLTINSGGAINADYQGCPGGPQNENGYGPNTSTGICAQTTSGYGKYSSGGAAHGGAGGRGGMSANPQATTYDVNTAPVLLGSGGGGYGGTSDSGSGGGKVRLDISGTLTVNGAISANGRNSTTAGGGSGGAIYITTNVLTGSSTISANGGSAGTGTGGGGGGGRIAVYYSDASGFTLGNITVTKGLKGTTAGNQTDGSDGTTYLLVYPVPTQPTITFPLPNSFSFALTGGSLSASAYPSNTESTNYGTHSSSDWKVQTGSDCSVDSGVAWSSLDDSTNKTSITIGGTLSASTTYYACVRYTNAIGDSDWSEGIQFFTITDASITQTNYDFSTAEDYTAGADITVSGGVASTNVEVWTNRRPIIISNLYGADLTNGNLFLALINANFSGGSDLDAAFDTAKADGSDIRFYDSDGTTPLGFWIEDWTYTNDNTANDSATIWVRIPSVLTAGKTIYMDYGNPGATTTSDFNDVETNNYAGDSSLVAQWEMDEGSGTSVADSSGNGHTGAFDNAWLGADSNFASGNAIEFNGAGTHEMTTGLPINTTFSNDFTLETWVMVDEAADDWGWFFGEASGGLFLFGKQSGTATLHYNIDGIGSNGSIGSYTAAAWHHMVLTHDKSEANSFLVYIDGALAGTYNEQNVSPSSTGNLILGRRSTGEEFDGKLDEVRVYNKSMSLAEVQAHYAHEPYNVMAMSATVEPETTIGSTLDVRVMNTVGLDYLSLYNFIETLGPNTNGSVKYQLSPDGTNWYYFNTATYLWTSATAGILTEMNTDDEINAYLSQLVTDVGTGALKIASFLLSSGDALDLSNLALTYINNTAPSVVPPGEGTSLASDGSGYLTFTATVSDVDSDTTKLKVEYSDDGGSTWKDPYLVSAASSSGTVDLENSNTYQIGTANAIDTDGGEITLTVVWDTKSMSNNGGLGGLDDTRQSDIQIRVTPNDGSVDGTTQTSASLTIDDLDPIGMASLAKVSATSTSINLSWTALSSEDNFNHYEIWYGTILDDVNSRSGSALEWDNSDDADFTTMATAATTISPLTAEATYYFKIFAVDNFGNEATLSAISSTLNRLPTISTVSPSLATNGTGRVTISYIVDDGDDNSVQSLVEYNVGSGWTKATLSEEVADVAVSSGATPTVENDNPYQVGAVSTSSGAVTVTVVWLSQTDTPTANVSNAQIRVTGHDGIEIGGATSSSDFTVDNVAPSGLASLVSSSTTSSTMTLGWTAATSEANFNHYEVWYGTVSDDVAARTGTALEWDNDNDPDLLTLATNETIVTGLSEGLTYYWKLFGIDNYGNETSLTLTAASNGSPVMTAVTGLQISTDGTGDIRITYVVDDFNDHSVQSRVEYNIGGEWTKATLSESGSDITVSSGSVPTVENDNTYQIGAVSTTAGANTVTVVWDAMTDAPTTDINNAQVRVIGLDGIEVGSAGTSDAFTIDNVVPSGLSSFSVTTRATTSLAFSWTPVASETHFGHYEIWYSTNSDFNQSNGTEWDDGDDPLLTTMSTSVTTITGLTSGLTYYFSIYALDSYGNELILPTISAITNSGPTINTVTAASATNGTGRVTISYTASDTDLNNVQSLVEYNTGSGWTKATLSESASDISVSSGTAPTIENDNTYPIGGVSTSGEENTVTLIWLSKTDVPAGDLATAQVRVTGYDGIEIGDIANSELFTLDNVSPLNMSNLVLETGTNTILCQWTAVSSETNFNHYEIWYGTSNSAVLNRTNDATEYDGDNNAALLAMNTNSSSLAALSTGTTYSVALWAIDDFGNESGPLSASIRTSGASTEIATSGGGSGGSGSSSSSSTTSTSSSNALSGEIETEDEEGGSSLSGEDEPNEIGEPQTLPPEQESISTPPPISVSQTEPSEPQEQTQSQPPEPIKTTETTDIVNPEIDSETSPETESEPTDDNVTTSSSPELTPPVLSPQIPITPTTRQAAIEDSMYRLISDDEDGDGIPDWYEEAYAEDNKNFNPDDDDDDDGLTNKQEFLMGTNLRKWDSDNDKISDGEEFQFGSDPNKYDTDSDGLPDAAELDYGTKFNLWDTDGDGFKDSVEIASGSDPLDIYNIPIDGDLDGAPDEWEEQYPELKQIAYNEPKKIQGIDKPILLSFEMTDSDSDGLTDADEMRYGSNPTSPDTDGDGIKDGAEIFDYKTSPTSPTTQEELYQTKISNIENNEMATFADENPIFKGVSEPDSNVIMIIIPKDKGEEMSFLSALFANLFGLEEQILTKNVATDETGKFLAQPNLDNGEYLVIVRSLDRFGNIKEESLPYEITINTDLASEIIEPKQLNEVEIDLDRLKLIRLADNKPYLYGIAKKGYEVVTTWQSKSLTSNLLVDTDSGEFIVNAPETLEEGLHDLFIYAVNPNDNLYTSAININFEVLLTGVSEAINKPHSLGFWLAIGGGGITLILLGFLIFRRREKIA